MMARPGDREAKRGVRKAKPVLSEGWLTHEVNKRVRDQLCELHAPQGNRLGAAETFIQPRVSNRANADGFMRIKARSTVRLSHRPLIRTPQAAHLYAHKTPAPHGRPRGALAAPPCSLRHCPLKSARPYAAGKGARVP
ncbi:hypothetical protein PT2222_100187 [Paraburkholderia tropica]